MDIKKKLSPEAYHIPKNVALSRHLLGNTITTMKQVIITAFVAMLYCLNQTQSLIQGVVGQVFMSSLRATVFDKLKMTL